ncbi:MAG TPA: dihydrofolate reductase family protein [Patescibacteria group bacterium]
MRKLIVLTFVSLDGVMQAPGGKGEDPSGGFDLEGWTVPLFDEVLGNEMGKQMGLPFDLLLGRKTYDIFAAYWPQHNDEVGQGLNKATKYVVSNGTVNTEWKETIQIKGDVVAEIRKLKQQAGPMIQVHGSSNLLQTLLANDLVDELWLKIFPLTLGKGKRLFSEGTRSAAFKLMESKSTPSGVIIASYKRDGELKSGSFT